MIEALFKIPYSVGVSVAQRILDRPRLRLECWWCNQPNEDEIGNYIAFWIRIINPSKESLYFGRIQAKDSKGSLFFPSVFEVKSGQEIPARNNIVALIPCGHIISTMPIEISVIDAMETQYKLKGRKLSKAVSSLVEEVTRLEALGCSVHPRTY